MQGRSVRGLALIVSLGIITVGGSARAETGRHCAYRLQPTSRSGHTIEARLVPLGCFATFSEAVAGATGGSVELPVTATPSSTTEEDLARATVRRGAVLIGTEYDATGFSGGSTSYSAPDACAGNTYQISYVGDALNNTFQSGKGFGGCDHNKKYQNRDFGGNVITCTPNCSDYGALAGAVSSLRWKP